MDDLVSRRAAIDAVEESRRLNHHQDGKEACAHEYEHRHFLKILMDLPSAQPTLYGYNIEHLELIARVLQKEDLPPERIVEVLTDIGRIVAIVRDEFEEALRKAIEQCMT